MTDMRYHTVSLVIEGEGDPPSMKVTCTDPEHTASHGCPVEFIWSDIRWEGVKTEKGAIDLGTFKAGLDGSDFEEPWLVIGDMV